MGKSIKGRYFLLDELRGFAILCMIIFHGLYLYTEMFGNKTTASLFSFFGHAQPYFAIFFVLLSGLCSVLSHSNIKRGLRLAVIAAGISAVTIAAGEFGLDVAIYFGIIHLLACAILFYALFYRALDRVPSLLGAAINLVLFLVTYPVPDGKLWLIVKYYRLPQVLYSSKYLFWLGLPGQAFQSADYFPVIPWLFIFLCGYYIGRFFKKHGFPALFKLSIVPFFGTVGRNSLLIYILHQPVLYSIFLLISRIR